MAYYTHPMESARHLTLRLSDADAATLEQLRSHTGLSKTDIVKRALRHLAASAKVSAATAAAPSLFSLGKGSFGLHGDASRQAATIKAVVRERIKAKRQG